MKVTVELTRDDGQVHRISAGTIEKWSLMVRPHIRYPDADRTYSTSEAFVVAPPILEHTMFTITFEAHPGPTDEQYRIEVVE